MTDRPIIFSAPMVRALLAGRKTQTRRLIHEPHDFDFTVGWYHPEVVRRGEYVPGPRTFGLSAPDGYWTQKLLYAPGDRLYVREAWRFINTQRFGETTQMCIGFEADGDDLPNRPFIDVLDPEQVWYGKAIGWFDRRRRQGRFMPRWASRLTLHVEGVKVERLQDISETDAQAEGMSDPSLRDLGGDLAQAAWSERQVFSRLWQHLHGAESWDGNPFVVALTFRVEHGNIDRLPANPQPETPNG